MENYILGLDLGPTSVGWAAVKLDKDNNPVGFVEIPNGNSAIPAMGVRVFEAGIDDIGQGKNEKTKNVPRREKRSLRRIIRRRRARKLKTLSFLQKKGLLPEDVALLEDIYRFDPYELRARAVRQKIMLDELGRIILHIARRRGFKSNRKQPEKEGEKGKIKDGIRKLQAEKADMTIGQYWHKKLQESKGKAPQAIRNKGSYNLMATREDYRQELDKILNTQRQYYPDIITDDFTKQLKDILFSQIPFELSGRKKRKVIGMCSLIPSQRRCSLANRKAQEFRLLQKINDLQIIENFKYRPLKTTERQALYEGLMSKKELTFKQIRKLLDLDDNAGFNLEHEGNNKLVGNAIDAAFASGNIFGKQWAKLDELTKQEIWDIFLQKFFTEDSQMTAQQLADLYLREFKLKVKNPAKLESISPPVGNISFSQKALDKLLPYMRDGYNLYEAQQKAGFQRKWRCLKKLPVPDKSQGFQCSNPIVRTTLFQVRKIVNTLIREIGKPQRIIIETTRDFNAGADRRQQIIKRQKENQTNREKARQRIREYYGYDNTVPIKNIEVTKYLLWQQQNELCPYSLRKIGIGDLFSRSIEIDHILPYSMSLDNSMANKVVCFANENQDKRQNTPISWLGENSPRFQQIKDAIDNERFGPDKRKWERFLVSNEEIADKYTPERLLRDTSYIATEVRSFLQRLYPHKTADQKVATTKGAITAELRHIWVLDPILRDGADGPKNRDDLRHHAVDAAVIAVSSAGMINRVTKRLQEAWPQRPSRVSDIPAPWDGYAQDLFNAIKQTKVSHRVQRRVRGKLHKETIFHKETNGPHKGKFITTVSLRSITPAQVKKICDNRIKQLVQDRMKAFGNKADKAFAEPLYLPANPEKERKIQGDVPIRKVRIAETSTTMVQIDDNIWCEPGSNHHVEIFKAKVKGKQTLIRRVYTLLEVARNLAKMKGCTDPEKRKRAIIRRENPFPHDPTITDVEFIMSLSIGESVIMKNDEGKDVLARVGKISAGSENSTSIYITFLEHQLSRVEGNITGKTLNAYCLRSMKTFTERNIRKVTVDPLGRIRWAHD